MNTSNSNIICPHCKQSIEISAALRTQMVDEFTQKLQAQRAKDKQAMAEQLSVEKSRLRKSLEVELFQQQSVATMELKQELSKKNKQVEEMEKQELQLRRRERELEEVQRKQALLIERKITEEKEKWIGEVKKEDEQIFAMRIQEKDKALAQLQKTIEELRRQSQQGSMQVQGDAAETDVKEQLILAFPNDRIQDVPTGFTGADLHHEVLSPAGQKLGVLLWEIKRTKAFSEGWIAKLKSDQVNSKADIAILVTEILPKESRHFFERKGIWICQTSLAVSLAKALRAQLISISQMKAARNHTDSTLSQLFTYVTTPEFKSRVEQLVLTYIDMKEDLEREERALRASIQKRTKQLDRMVAATAGLYGDFQGIIGSSLPKVEQLELPDSVEELPLLENRSS